MTPQLVKNIKMINLLFFLIIRIVSFKINMLINTGLPNGDVAYE